MKDSFEGMHGSAVEPVPDAEMAEPEHEFAEISKNLKEKKATALAHLLDYMTAEEKGLLRSDLNLVGLDVAILEKLSNEELPAAYDLLRDWVHAKDRAEQKKIAAEFEEKLG